MVPSHHKDSSEGVLSQEPKTSESEQDPMRQEPIKQMLMMQEQEPMKPELEQEPRELMEPQWEQEH